MPTVKGELDKQLEQDSKFLSNIALMREISRELGLDNVEAYIHVTSYSFSDDELPSIVIHPSHTPEVGIFMDGGGPALNLVDTTPRLAQIARLLLPKVGKLEKGFDEQNNQVTLTCVYRGIKIVVKDETPKTCGVERVEEVIDVPEKIVPAHQEKRVRYRLVGDCDPILADEASGGQTDQGFIETRVAVDQPA